MGAPESEPQRDFYETPHRVEISRDFHLGKFPVTQKQWRTVMGSEPWKGQPMAGEGENLPATCVSWHEASEFCKKLSEREGVEYRLPTEAQWEYACRGGSQTMFPFGDDVGELGTHAWFKDGNVELNGAQETGKKVCNEFGLHDMTGNVWEWCDDWFDFWHYEASEITDPSGPSAGSDRVCRGGCWSSSSRFCRPASRGSNPPDLKSSVLGFRIVRIGNN